jgi:hypothetical protein
MTGFARIGRIAKDPLAAMAFAVDITNYIKGKHSDTISCWARVGGPSGEIVWQLSFPDMAALQKYLEKIQADQQYWAKLKAAEGLFDTASIIDGVWNQLA